MAYTANGNGQSQDYAAAFYDAQKKGDLTLSEAKNIKRLRTEKIRQNGMSQYENDSVSKDIDDYIRNAENTRYANGKFPGSTYVSNTADKMSSDGSSGANGDSSSCKTAAAASSSSGTGSYDSDINGYGEALKAQALAEARAKLYNTISNLNEEEASIAPQYRQKMNQAATNSQIAGKNYAEYLAGRGSSAGAAAQSALGRSISLQSTLGSLSAQQQQAEDAVARQRAAAKNDYESGLAQAYANINANTMQQRINARQNEEANEINAAQLTGMYKGSPTLQKQQIDSENEAYKKDPDFASNYANVVNGKVSLDDVKRNKVQLIQDYGYNGYAELYKAAGGI